MGHHECNDGSCSTNSHAHGQGSGCGQKGCGCGENCHCKSCCGKHEHGHFSDELLALADEAWMELLKEKIKQKIEETTGQHLDQLASIVSTANHTRWNNKMGLCKNNEDYEAKIADFFNH